MYYLARTQMLSNYSYLESLKLVLELGYDGAEISISDKNFKVRDSFFNKDTIKDIKSIITKMKSVSISCHMDYVNNDENLKLIIKTFTVAQELGIDIVIINGAKSTAKNEEQKKEEWEKMIYQTAQLCLEAEKRGIRIAKEYEPNFITNSTKKLLKVFEEINSANLYANIDLGHVFLCDPEPMEALNNLQGKIIHGHIENMKKDIHDHLLPYEGDMDLSLYLNKLTEIGFDGPLALDLYKYDYESVLKKSLNYLRSL